MNKKKAEKQAEQKAKRAARRRKKQQKTILYSIITIVAIAAALYFGVELLRQADEAKAGDKVETQPANHIPACVPNYTTTPPTSGCHQPNWDSWGIHTSPIANDLQVHNLEHGGVIVQYRQAVTGVSDEYIDDLTSFVNDLRKESRYCKLILAPYPTLEPTIAITAWGWIQTLEDFDEEIIKKFVDDHIGNEGPEFSASCT
jgi:hypothetical protein